MNYYAILTLLLVATVVAEDKKYVLKGRKLQEFNNEVYIYNEPEFNKETDYVNAPHNNPFFDERETSLGLTDNPPPAEEGDNMQPPPWPQQPQNQPIPAMEITHNDHPHNAPPRPNATYFQDDS